MTEALLSEQPEIQAACFHALGNLNAQKGFATIRVLYDAEAEEEPGSQDLEGVKQILLAACEHYRDAVTLNPGLTAAATNLQRVEEYIKLLERKIQEQAEQEQQDEQSNQNTPPPPANQENNDGQEPPPPPQDNPPPPDPEKANSDFNDHIKNNSLQEDEGEIRHEIQRHEWLSNPTGGRFKNY